MIPVYQLPNKWQRFSLCITEKKCLKEGQYKKNSSSVQISQKDPGFQSGSISLVFAKMFFAIRVAKYFQQIWNTCHRGREGNWSSGKSLEVRNCIANCHLKLKDLKHIPLSISFWLKSHVVKKSILILKVFQVSEVSCKSTLITIHKQHIIFCGSSAISAGT